ncbi:hypothetical protein H9P43_005850 [Blastocladiella emersonii ATCC 22665]|nr:hypothetical protein H9P43_005850 [Blastocladiella emersonii ATCC 22665]
MLAAAPHLTVETQHLAMPQSHSGHSMTDSSATAASSSSMRLMVATRAYTARPGTDELTVQANNLSMSPTRRGRLPGRRGKPFLPLNRADVSISRHLSQPDPAPSHAQAPVVGVLISLHGIQNAPPVEPPVGLTLANHHRSMLRVGMVRGGTVVGNVHTLLAYRDGAKGWRFTESTTLFGSGAKYDEHRLFVRVDSSDLDVHLVLELVHTFRVPGVTGDAKAKLRHVSGGWAAHNLLTSAGDIAEYRRYSLRMREKRPDDKDAVELHSKASPTSPNAPESTSPTKQPPANGRPTLLHLNVSRLEPKWHAATLALPPHTVSSLGSLSMIAAFCAQLNSARTATRGIPHVPAADPLLGWLGALMDDPHELPRFAAVWRAERKRLRPAERKDPVVAGAALRRVAATWYAVGATAIPVIGAQTGGGGSSAAAAAGTAVAKSLAVLTRPPESVLFRPMSTRELKVWV